MRTSPGLTNTSDDGPSRCRADGSHPVRDLPTRRRRRRAKPDRDPRARRGRLGQVLRALVSLEGPGPAERRCPSRVSEPEGHRATRGSFISSWPRVGGRALTPLPVVPDRDADISAAPSTVRRGMEVHVTTRPRYAKGSDSNVGARFGTGWVRDERLIVDLIARRSWVRIPPPPPTETLENSGPSGPLLLFRSARIGRCLPDSRIPVA